MSPNPPRTSTSDAHTHTGRRRHAAPRDPKWARRAGLVGGVVSALALSGAAAPAMADNTHTAKVSDKTARGSSASSRSRTVAYGTPLSTAVTARQAVVAVQWEATSAAFAAQRAQTTTDAARAAAAARQAAHRKAVAAAKAARAARERAAAAAARPTAQAIPVASTSAAPTPTATASAAPASSSSKVDQLIAFLKAQLGKPYVYGAAGPDSYDCSGLTQAAFALVGVDLPRTSQDQSTVGTPVSLSDLQPGDLVFWGGEGSAYHVAVYIGDGQYLAAANPSKGVVIEQMSYSMPDWAVRVL